MEGPRWDYLRFAYRVGIGLLVVYALVQLPWPYTAKVFLWAAVAGGALTLFIDRRRM